MKDFRIHLKYILEAMQILQTYTEGVSLDTFLTSVQLQDAVIRRLEILGEGAKKMPPDFRQEYPSIPWRKMAALRDVLAHDYISLRLNTIWNTVINDILPLQHELEAIVQKELSSSASHLD